MEWRNVSLLDFAKNVYSQNGEDGVIEEILLRIHSDVASSHWCVEFSAWDGRFLSNTFSLVEYRDWNAVYIEGDPEKFVQLEATAREFSKVRPILAMVGGTKGSGTALDDVLAATECPVDYDLLSVDIDSNDLDVWTRHTDYRPSIVLIEINSSVPPGILRWHNGTTQGNSFSAVMQVAIVKEYTLVCHTGNLIFVKNELADLIGLEDIDRAFPERLFIWDWAAESKEPSVWKRFKRAASQLRLSVIRQLDVFTKRI